MKNELGIEVKCENCLSGVNANTCCWYPEKDSSKIVSTNLCHFKPYSKVIIARIKELQAKLEKYERDEGGATFAELLHEVVTLRKQQFTTEELQFIKRAVLEYSEMSDFDYKPVNEKIERILNDENNM